jgi:hypothetical protein
VKLALLRDLPLGTTGAAVQSGAQASQNQQQAQQQQQSQQQQQQRSNSNTAAGFGGTTGSPQP